MKLHSLKIKAEYANEKLKGNKPFEIRFNDRGFKVGDVIKYSCIDSRIVDEKIRNKLYYIAYITNYEQKEGYIVFCDKEVEQCRFL
jgi:hypothetical protein